LSKLSGTRSARFARVRATCLQCGLHAPRKTGIETTSDKQLGEGCLLDPQLRLGGVHGKEFVRARPTVALLSPAPGQDASTLGTGLRLRDHRRQHRAVSDQLRDAGAAARLERLPTAALTTPSLCGPRFD
jgi:hypothetical protein